ncbi:long chain acyl-CoA synthetase 1-like [Impatiens glandulifera]|uniref:long chain acyl-CoA synthetase 1-like n=1 Tax=Impatiens glandulifera TaxID=253017 RepID=UPI001FB0AB5A|nr:long chain acyl-CoA synthetase 1-like [Impatiens glandulifera]
MKKFAVKVEEGRKRQDQKPAVGPIYRNSLDKDGFLPLDPSSSTTWDLFRASVEKNPANKMLGWREFSGGKFGGYVWKTYKEVYDEVLAVGSALRSLGAEPGCRVGIYGSNCPQWIVAMETCSAHSLICVPLYDTLGAGAVEFILDHAEVEFVFVQDKKLKQLLTDRDRKLTHEKRLKLIVSFSSVTKEEKEDGGSRDILVYSWTDFLHLGKERSIEIFPPRPMDICTVMYTSGTSGEPKGVILTHENITTCIRGLDIFLDQFEDKMTVEDVYISFLPLAHILDRLIEEFFFRKGASVGYFHGDINELKDDLMELKPTFLAGVPRVFERIHQGVLKGVEELNPRRRKIFELLFNYKRYWMNKGFKQKNASWLADLLAFRKVKSRLGGRVRLIVSGGAPLSTEVEEFLRVTSCAFVVQGYGLTETCGLSSVGFPDEMAMMGAVGPPFVYTEFRLEEVPEMGYDPFGDPSRGEICVRGKSCFSGYYNNPKLTNEVFTDGWFHTGDIGEMQANGVIKIIDRKKNLIKLSQGEYVAVEYLEKVYSITPIIEDIWVYGDSFKSMLIAIIVPNEENTVKWGNENGYKECNFSQLCSLEQLHDHVLEELKSTAARNKLRGYEYIKGVILEFRPFDGENSELVTPTLKKRRDKMFNAYKAEIHNLYKKMEAGKGDGRQ